MRAISAALSFSAPAPAFSAMWSGLPAFGIVNRGGRRDKNRSATRRGVAPWAAAIPQESATYAIGTGEIPMTKGGVADDRDVMRFTPGNYPVLDGSFLQVI